MLNVSSSGFDPQPSCPAQNFRSARRLNAPGWEELGQLPFPFLEGTPLRGRTYAGSLEGIVALQAGILPGPPGPLVSALEARRRVYGPLPHEKRFVVGLVGYNTIAVGVALPLDEVAHPKADIRRFMEEPLPRVIEDRPFIHIVREDMAVFHLMDRGG
jgi:hypothetical protein